MPDTRCAGQKGQKGPDRKTVKVDMPNKSEQNKAKYKAKHGNARRENRQRTVGSKYKPTARER